jgi:hypothetical protein
VGTYAGAQIPINIHVSLQFYLIGEWHRSSILSSNISRIASTKIWLCNQRSLIPRNIIRKNKIKKGCLVAWFSDIHVVSAAAMSVATAAVLSTAVLAAKMASVTTVMTVAASGSISNVSRVGKGNGSDKEGSGDR